MSDILSPILIVLNHEIEAFWCFAHYMCNLVSLNFLFKLDLLQTSFSTIISQTRLQF